VTKNLLVLMDDQHNRNYLGCYGNDLVKTPNLDALAARGTRFTKGYTNSPICVPAHTKVIIILASPPSKNPAARKSAVKPANKIPVFAMLMSASFVPSSLT